MVAFALDLSGDPLRQNACCILLVGCHMNAWLCIIGNRPNLTLTIFHNKENVVEVSKVPSGALGIQLFIRV